MRNKLILFLALTLWGGAVLNKLCLAEEDYLTITTYYPSPYGSYNELDTRILWFGEERDGLVGFNYPDTTYDRRLRITAGKEDKNALGLPVTNTQGASIDLHGNNYTDISGMSGRLDLVAGSATEGNITFWTGSPVNERMRITREGRVGIKTNAPDAAFEVADGFYFLGGSGDITGNGVLDIWDWSKIIAYLRGTHNLSRGEYARADINGDGRVDVLDMELIIYVINKTITLEQAHHQTGKFLANRAISARYNNDINMGLYGGNVSIGNTDPKARFHSIGSTILGVAKSSVSDTDLQNNTVNLYVDETNNKLKFKVKYSTGTVKTGEADLF